MCSFMTSSSNHPEYQCPICHSQMALKNKTLICESGHSFDFAKEGYVHLLPVQLKKSLHPGDDKLMVMARRAFLSEGFYDFMRDALFNEIKRFPHNNLLDLGCGEGFYTNYIKEHLPSSQVYGVDISKDAIKYAAKRNKNVHYSVATNAHTPFRQHQFDLIINIFAPLIGIECERVLKPDGKILSVAPAPHHLIELKNVIYDTPDLHQEAKVPDGFVLSQTQNIQQGINITTKADLDNLLKMTPFGWKITKEKQVSLTQELPLSITLDFSLNEFSLDN